MSHNARGHLAYFMGELRYTGWWSFFPVLLAVKTPLAWLAAVGIQAAERWTATRVLADGAADAVAFGRLFIANPDLPERFRFDAPLNPLDEATLYGGAEKGYTDYPVMAPRLVKR